MLRALSWLKMERLIRGQLQLNQVGDFTIGFNVINKLSENARKNFKNQQQKEKKFKTQVKQCIV